MRVCITGSRDWGRPEMIYKALDGISFLCEAMDVEMVIVHGGCPTGADKAAEDWAMDNFSARVKLQRYLAQWDRYGKRAGPLRNQEMAESQPDLVLAFWDGKSAGTRHMIETAVIHRIPTIVRIL